MNPLQISLSDYGSRSRTPSPVNRMMSSFAGDFTADFLTVASTRSRCTVIEDTALVVIRLVVQFLAQTVGVIVLRRRQ